MMINGKKILLITALMLVFTFAISLCYGYIRVPRVELISSTLSTFRLLNGIKIFFNFFPGILSTAYLIGWAFEFGENSGGSLVRFSSAMFERYKFVLISSLLGVLCMTIVTEIALPCINNKSRSLMLMPSLQKEYANFAEGMYGLGRYELAYKFARLALEIDPQDKNVQTLVDKTEKESKTKKKVSLQKKEEPQLDLSLTVNKGYNFGYSNLKERFSLSGPINTIDLVKVCRKCMEEGDWFGAHYYAELALSIISERDINLSELRQVSSDSWNRLKDARDLGTTDEQKIFRRKMEGYNALLEGDCLKAYYIYKTLSLESKALSLDPDVVRYLEAAEQSLQKQYFFVDETYNIQNFETASNVYFKLKGDNGYTNIFFIKGITQASEGVELVQYLRGLSIFTLDENGEYTAGSYTSYAKMMGVSSNILSKDVKEEIGLDSSVQFIPYIMLRSVDRNHEADINQAVMKKGSVQDTTKGYLLLPMNYNDFTYIKEAGKGAENMSMTSLLNFSNIASKYGYSSEIYNQILLNRVLYPVYILVCLVVLSAFAWHGRTPPKSVFKFNWILVIPFFTLIFIGMYKAAMIFFQIINFGILGNFGDTYGLVVGFIIYAIALFIASINFLACKNSMTL